MDWSTNLKKFMNQAIIPHAIESFFDIKKNRSGLFVVINITAYMGG